MHGSKSPVSRNRALAITVLSLIVSSHSLMALQAKSRSPKRSAVQNTWVKKVLNQLSLEEKIGQMIMPAFRGTYLHSISAEFRETERQIREKHVGGFILFAGDVYESAVLIDKMQSLSRLPLLIASDFERGTTFRVRNTVSFPWNMAIGATASEHWAHLQGRITGQEARAMGVHWIFAPVLDVNNNPANPVINIRSYGEDPYLVARLGAAFVHGAQEAGVLATGKHFPGHGDTSVDSHLGLPVNNADRHRLEQLELIPFRKAIETGIWSIMTAHMAVPALEPDSRIPATLSTAVLRDILQNELGFSNLIVTDSFQMAGLARDFWTGAAAVQAVKAGVDVILDPPQPDVISRALQDAVSQGEISQERLNHSVKKILGAKAWLGLHKSRHVSLDAIDRLVGDPELQRQGEQMAEASITLVRDSRQLLPLDVRRTLSTYAILVLGRDLREDTLPFQQSVRQRLESITFDKITAETPEEELNRILEKAKDAELVLCAAFARLVTGTGTVELPERLAAWVRQLTKLDRPLVMVALGSPYIIQQFPDTKTYLCTFSNADVSQVAAVRAIFGEVPIQGKLPVSIPQIAEIYGGIVRPALSMKLNTHLPKGLQPVGERLNALDTLIEEHIQRRTFPGASVAVGYQGHLVYHKAFGKFDYSPNGTPVTTDTLYDLASLTKVVSATTLAMQLYEKGSLKPEFPVSRFYPSFIGGGRDKITVRHLLTHSSGLPGHLPFYKDTAGKREFVRRILETPLEYEPGTKTTYSDLGIIFLGDILEKISAETLDALSNRHIFQPLGMTHVLFTPPSELKARIAPTENDPWRGRLLQGEVHDENAFAMGGVSAHAGLFGASGDLAVFCQMLLNGGVYDHRRIVKKSTLERFVARQNLPSGSSRALGWDTPSEGCSAGRLLSSKAFGHTGFTGTSIWIDPPRQLFIILLTNRVYPNRDNSAILEVRPQIADIVVHALEDTFHKPD